MNAPEMSAAVAAIQRRFELICHRTGVNIILDVAVQNSQRRKSRTFRPATQMALLPQAAT
jgi:hypothetical protein